jgi:hypothetical protein
MIAPLAPSLQYRLPDLDTICAIKGGSNPHYERASAESREWINSYRLFPPKKQAYFTRGSMELLGSYTFPYADYAKFRTTCDLVCSFIQWSLLLKPDSLSQVEPSLRT